MRVDYDEEGVALDFTACRSLEKLLPLGSSGFNGALTFGRGVKCEVGTWNLGRHPRHIKDYPGSRELGLGRGENAICLYMPTRLRGHGRQATFGLHHHSPQKKATC